VGFEPKAIHRKTKSSVKEKNTTTKIKKNNKKENEDNNEEKKEKSQKKKKRLAGNSVDKANKRKIENKPVTKTKSLMTEKNRKKKDYESSSSSSSSSSSGSGSDSDSSSSEKNDSKNNKKDKDNKKKKSESSSNKSSITPTPSSSVSNSDNSDEEKEKEKEKDKEKENDENKKNLIKSKTNLDKQSLNIEVQNKKEENKENTEEKNKKEEEILNIVPKIESFRPASTEKRKGSIILGNTYLRRRSMDNPFTRERLELLVNQMTLKQNGGNTLFLRNYENGPSYAKEITIITKDNTQTLKKNIKINECTKAGCSGPGIVKTNQDAYFVKDNFLKNPDYFFIGVCDGHGEQGQLVSNYVANKLPTYITDLSNENIINAFKKVNKEIYANSKMDSNMSGTTVVSIIMTPNNIICVNLGDSRAALFKYDSGIYYCKNLSRDHKPCEADETKRIINSGGRVKKCYDEDHKRFIGPDRVWMKNREEPGLAMTRSLGDKIAHDIGVIDEPEFKTFTYDGSEKFIIIASDGLWEYVSGDQCISIVKPFYEEGLDSKEAAFALTKEAFRRWKRKEVAIDDITVVVIFFD
jgi:serine/threonine protein phosphatase PrpC